MTGARALSAAASAGDLVRVLGENPTGAWCPDSEVAAATNVARQVTGERAPWSTFPGVWRNPEAVEAIRVALTQERAA